MVLLLGQFWLEARHHQGRLAGDASSEKENDRDHVYRAKNEYKFLYFIQHIFQSK